MNRSAIFLMAALGFLLGACGSSRASLPESTYVPGPSSSAMGLQVTGVLVEDETGCISLQPDPGEMVDAKLSLLWPVGSTRSGTGSNETVAFPGGKPSVHIGERVTLTGGTVSDTGSSSCVDAANAFEVQDLMSAST